MFLNLYLKQLSSLTNLTFSTRTRDLVDAFPLTMVSRVFYQPHSLSHSNQGFEGSHNLFYFQYLCDIICDPMDVGKESLYVGGLISMMSSPYLFLFHFRLDVFISISYSFKYLG
jgi:hypothetical protein